MQAVDAKLAARYPQKSRAFIRREFQAVRKQLSDLPGRPPFSILNLAESGNRASDPFGKLLARETQSVATLTQPFAKGLHIADFLCLNCSTFVTLKCHLRGP